MNDPSVSKRPLVLYHASCADGHCAAWIARRVYGDRADYLPVQYGEPPPDVAGRQLFVLDFSYKRPVMERMIADAGHVVVLDHHKTAQAELDGLDVPHPGEIVFDMNRSGARLTWDRFFRGEEPPWLVNYVEDRDLWRNSLPFTKEINAAIASYPMTWEAWDMLAEAIENGAPKV